MRKINAFCISFILMLSMFLLFCSNNFAASPNNWVCWGHDIMHTRNTPVIGPQTNTISWRYGLAFIHMASSATIIDDSIYITAGEKIYALDTVDPRRIKWAYDVRYTITSSPAADCNTVYIGASNGKLYSLNALNGRLNWSFQTDEAIFSSPILYEAVIYMGSSDNFLYAINENGQLKWKYDAEKPISSTVAIDKENQTIYFLAKNKLCALDLKNGSLKWDYSIYRQDQSYYYQNSISPAIDNDGSIYITLDNLYSFYPNGTLKWELFTDSYFRSCPAIGNDGTLYIGDTDGLFHSIDQTDGDIKWSYETQGAIFSSPAIGGDGTIYFGSCDGIIYALDEDGFTKWFYPAKKRILNSPAIGPNGKLYIAMEDQLLTFSEQFEH